MENLNHPKLDIKTLNMSIADFIGKFYESPVFDSPTQQTYDTSCFYIRYIGDQDFKKEIDRTGLQNLYIDITYEEPHNIPNLFDKYMEVANTINNNIKDLTYNLRDKNDEIIWKIPLYTLDRKMSWDSNAMHYKFKLMLRVIEEIEEAEKIMKVNRKITAKGEHNG